MRPVPFPTFDYLIVGQGLAGSIVAWLLIREGRRVIIADNQPESAASRTAAGIVNPVTGRRWVKPPLVDICLPAAHRLYDTFELQFNRPFFHEKGFLRVLRSEADRTVLRKRRADVGYADYFGDYLASGNSGYALDDPWGCVEQWGCGFLDTESLLDVLNHWFQERGCLVDEPFLFEDLDLDKTPLCWRGRPIQRVVFCEGARVVSNPWFRWLPFQLSKGDILTLASEIPMPRHIINREQWLLPIDDGIFKFGASYRWAPLDERPDPEAERQLLARFHTLFKPAVGAGVIRHQAGIRPGTRDKQPFVGVHPRDDRLCLCNGFGSKGVLLIPWYAQRLVDFLLHNTALPSHGDIRRYYALYSAD
jgi:glycine oxidase